MSQAEHWRAGWAAALRRVAGVPQAPTVAAGLLAASALAQAIWWAASARPSVIGGGWLLGLIVVALPSLAGTLPLGFFWARPAAAAVIMCVASVLSLVAFRTLTVAALIALLAAACRLGRCGLQLVAAGLAVPFVVVALVPAGSLVAGQSVSRAVSPAPDGRAVATAVSRTSGSGESRLVLAVLAAALTPAAALAGAAWRSRSEAARHTATRQAIAGSLLEHTARGERARISRELHDVVAHHVSMIAVQAETARLATPGMPAAGAQQLAAIGDTARAALTEMRRLLGVLREDTAAVAPDRRPQPGLSQVIELLDETRDASKVGARLIVRGWLTPLDPGVELAAYRIVQEALTNARRHAPGAAVDVELHFTDETLHVRVRDNGPGPPPSVHVGGLGLLGMRERAVAVGGELRTGPAPGGGFLVEARLPARVSGYRAEVIG